MAWLICGLGNPGEEYAHTRHNIGFDVLDSFCKSHDAQWSAGRHGHIATVKLRGRDIRLLKPNTYMNLSGKALAYWMQQVKPSAGQILVICDDLALPTGKLRIRAKGSHGGQNGLRHIIETLGTEEFPRMRIGIGQDFPKGRQVEYVLGQWPDDQKELVNDAVQRACNAIESFVMAGLPETMTAFNR